MRYKSAAVSSKGSQVPVLPVKPTSLFFNSDSIPQQYSAESAEPSHADDPLETTFPWSNLPTFSNLLIARRHNIEAVRSGRNKPNIPRLF
jgi:hypothetical protein